MNFYFFIKQRIVKIFKVIVLLIFASIGYYSTASSEYVKIVDGDSLEIGTRRIRLLNIDAPEFKQYCFTAKGKKYNCGKKAQQFLYDMLKSGNFDVECYSKKQDQYNRDLAECFVDGKNIGVEMLSAGWAVSYMTKSNVYLSAEREAKKQKIGVWQGKFMRPEYYRRLLRSEN
jgi:endonuclease YncB( thermonuclease family)